MGHDLKIFVINLARDIQRREYMENHLKELGLYAEFVQAVDGRDLCAADRKAYNRSKALRVYGGDMIDAEIGCYLSHYRLLQRIIAENIPYALILEDDVALFPALMPTVQAFLKKDMAFDIVRLETLRGKVKEPQSKKFLGQRLHDFDQASLYRLDTHVLGFGVYLISQAGAQRLVSYGKEMFMPIDQTADRFWDNDIVPYVFRPFLAAQRQDFDSRIETGSSRCHEDLPFTFSLLHRFQRIYDGFGKRLWLCFKNYT